MRQLKQLSLLIAFCSLAIFTHSCSDSATMTDGNRQPPKFNSKAAPGDSAKSFLEGDQYTDLQVEIDYMPGHAPTQEGLDSLQVFLQERLHKETITLSTPTEIPSGGQSSYTISDVRSIEEENRNNYTQAEDNTLHAYFLVLDGEFEQSNVLGVAYYNTSVAFFGPTIESVSGTPPTAPSEEKVEGTVFRHEFGHNMGLVGNGTPTQSDHKTDGSAHCTTQSCLMYPSVETTDFFSNFSGDIPELDAYCIEDLQANGGK